MFMALPKCLVRTRSLRKRVERKGLRERKEEKREGREWERRGGIGEDMGEWLWVGKGGK